VLGTSAASTCRASWAYMQPSPRQQGTVLQWSGMASSLSSQLCVKTGCGRVPASVDQLNMSKKQALACRAELLYALHA
jgi:hypothetical protein